MSRLSATLILILVFAAVAYPAINQAELDQAFPFHVAQRVMDTDGFTLNLNIDAPRWQTIESGNDQLSLATFEMGGALERPGRPLVPTAGRLFRLPPTSGVTVEVISAEYETLTGIDYAAYLGGEADHYGRVAKPVDEWYPGELVSVGEPALLRNFRVTNLITNPVQVNTARREVRVYNNIQVRVRFEGEDNRNALPAPTTRISEAFIPIYRLLLDWDDAELDDYTLYRGSVQVVMRESARQHLQDWIDWKLQKGWDLEFLTDDDVGNWSNTAIRNELRSRWQESENKFDYVVIVGDDQGGFSTPAGSGGGYGAGDQPYSTVAGDDNLADVGVGRISVQTTTQFAMYNNKVISYERDPDLDDTDWYLRGVVTRSDNHPGISKIILLRYWRHGMLDIGYTQVDTSWVPFQANNVAIDRINAGVTVYSTRGYINSGLNTGQINGLNNPFKLPVVFDVTCYTGNWSGGLGINEAYMLAGTANIPKGGIGGFGTATASTNPRFNNALGGGAGWALLQGRMPCMGAMTLMAKVNVWVNFYGNDNGGLNNFSQWFNLMGDPTVWLWTSIPQVLTVTADDAIELGQNSYEVLVEDDGEPVADAWVTLYKVDDDDEIIARGQTDSDGYAILDAPLRFTGEAILTVSKQNYAPYRLTVDVVSPEARVGYEEITFQDDGENGTVGNGNGIPEAGETIGLTITARNFGDSDATNVQVNVSSDDPWVTSITGTVDYGTLTSGESADGDGIVLVEIAPEAQHEWIMHLGVDFTASGETYEDDFPLTVNAPMFAVVDVNGTGGFDPGETTNITIEVMNVGGSDASASHGVLISNDPYLGVPDPDADFSPMDIGGSDVSTSFQVAAHQVTIPGHMAHASLVITTDDGQVDTTSVTIVIGEKETTDPSGPDHFGYYAFDNTDTGYDMAPQYDWVEINPAAPGNDYDGTRLDINDPGENQDDATVVELPFPVQYYGEEFDLLTVCSNGFVAMGSQADMYLNRNWTIPSPLGPNYMIAPYWDERHVSGQAGVFSYYDEANGRYIVEWYRTPDHINSNICTFQVIFYNQVAHPTCTGDTDILFQYETVNHSTGGMGSDVPWWTTGIENGTQDDGVLLAYWNQYYPGAATITAGRAILFSTNIALITGTVEGNVTDVATGLPIEGAMVHTSDYVFFDHTDANGDYQIEEVIIGDHEVVVDAVGYNSGYAENVHVADDSTTIVDFSLTHPEFHIDTEELNYQLPQEDSLTYTVNISNTGNGPLDYGFRVLFTDPEVAGFGEGGQPNRGELDDPWDENANFDLTGDETRNRGVMFMENHLWVSGSFNADVGYNKLYRYDKAGVLRGVYDQPVENHSSAGFYGIATDGQYIYGCDRGRLYQMEFTGQDVVQVQNRRVPVNNVRYIAYDPDRDLFWIGDLDHEVTAVNREGETVAAFEQEINPRGLGYYPDDEDGYNLYFICRATDENVYHIRKMDPQTGDVIDVRTFDNEGYPLGANITNKFNPLIWTYMAVIDGGTQDHIQVWEMELNTHWIDIDPQIGEIGPGDDQDVDISVFTYAFPAGTYNAWLEVNHNSIEQTFIIPMEIEVTGGNGGPGEPHFEPVDPTGRPYAVVVDDATFNGEPLDFGDEVGIFDGDLCVGAERFEGEYPLPIVTWQSDPDQEIPGFVPGNPILYRIWDHNLMVEAEAVPTYIQGNGEFGFGPFSEVTLEAGGIPQVILPLRGNYFELISTYIEPADLDAASVFGDVADLEIVYQDDGGIFIPPGINTIGDIDVTEGYQVFCSANSQITIEGAYVDPTIDFSLVTAQWNWLGYPFSNPLGVDVALSPIEEQVDIVLNDEGGFWIPGVINTIGDLQPGAGYFTFVNEDVTFQYNAGMALAAGSASDVWEIPVVEGAPPPTGLPYVVLARISEDLQAANPASIELYDGNRLVGKALVLEDRDFTPVIAWGGSADYDVSGFTAGHPLKVVLHSADGAKIPVRVEGEAPAFGEGAYASVQLTTNPIPTEFAVGQGYPNPFNPAVTVPFALPVAGEVTFRVYNVIGRQVFEAEHHYQAGYHRFIFDGGTAGHELVSGVYFLRVSYDSQVSTQKLLLLK